jgi:hypothetical protein
MIGQQMPSRIPASMPQVVLMLAALRGLADGPSGDDLSLAKQDDVVGRGLGGVRIVGGKDDGLSFVPKGFDRQAYPYRILESRKVTAP